MKTNASHKRVIVIGAGFSGMAVATCLAQKGWQVDVVERHDMAGGRARKFEADGFTFDMGPSWYWMPEVFDKYFEKFGHKTSDFYQLDRLSPSYRVFFEEEQTIDIPASRIELDALFESIEPNSSKALDKFLSEAKYKYRVGMDEFVWKPSLSIKEFLDIRIFKSALKLQMFSSISKQVRSLFKDSKLQRILEFPVLFLGAKPQNTPALYSLMNYADLELGTWYPQGGMYKIVEAMKQIAEEQGVTFHFNQDVKNIQFDHSNAKYLETQDGKKFEADYFVSSADYEFTERVLLGKKYRNYSDKYWQSRSMAPSSLLFYIGMDKQVPGLKHHNLFFDEDFDQHASEIYETPQYPGKPLFYACLPSKSDQSVAPKGGENMFLLIPLAPGLEDKEEKHDYYYQFIMDKLKIVTGIDVAANVVYKKVFSVNDFISEYNAFKGNAYGLANTLRQTAILKPRIKNRKLSNFYYTGQLTTPGPGVPPSLISGQMVADYIDKHHRNP